MASPVITSFGGVNSFFGPSTPENQSFAATITATDADLGDTLTYSIEPPSSVNADASKFSINPTTGELSFITPPNFEAPTDTSNFGSNTYAVIVRVTDSMGNSDLQQIIFTVTNANDAPVVTSSGTASIAENTTATVVYQATATDEDSGATITYSLTGTDAADFTIDSVTGDVRFVASPDFEAPADADGDNVYDVAVTATDNGAAIGTQSLAITVTDVNEAPPPSPPQPSPPPISTVPSAGPDLLTGTAGPDQIFAGAGNDTVFGLGGDDTLFGGTGNDQVYGGTGNDQAYGGDGMDSVFGGTGDDQVYGGAGNDMVGGGIGNDTVGGGDGNDSLYGADGDDQLFGAAGDDQLQGGNGADTIAAGIGNDTVYAGEGNDVVYASDGNDLVFGGGGNDTLFGGGGSDTIWGGAGNDPIYGGAGADRFSFAAGSGNDMIEGFNQAEGDVIDLQGQTYTVGHASDGDVILTLSGGGTIELDGITQFETAFVA